MNSLLSLPKLNREFYTREVLVVAKSLLGKILVKNNDGETYAGKIVEVEAYNGAFDEASHAFMGKTKRNEIIFGEGGYFYVYFTYGAHFCCNVVTGAQDSRTAVLLRAVEPLLGIEEMAKNRFGHSLVNEKEKLNLTSGPGKLCKAFDIDNRFNTIDLTGDVIFILDQKTVFSNNIMTSKRIGITKSVDLPWRFYITGNPYVSRK
jgi:DNA-3-methyladenine glycosylase